MEEKFEKIYNEVIKHNIDELEFMKQESKKEKRKPVLTLIFSILLSIIIYFCMKYLYNQGSISISTHKTVSTILYVLLFILTIWINMLQTRYTKYQKYQKCFKEKIIKPILESFNENLKYFPDDEIPISEYKDFKPEKFTFYNSEDILQGNIKNIKLKTGEIITERTVQDKDGGTTEIKVFEGIFAKIEIPKSFETEMYIRKQLQQDLEKMKIKMDSEKFNRVYFVYSPNEMKAFEILTSDLMEFLVSLKEKTKIEYDLTIKENIIYIRFHTGKIQKKSQMSKLVGAGRLFEPTEFNQEIIDKESLYNDYTVFYTCLDIINRLVNILNKT